MADVQLTRKQIVNEIKAYFKRNNTPVYAQKLLVKLNAKTLVLKHFLDQRREFERATEFHRQREARIRQRQFAEKVNTLRAIYQPRAYVRYPDVVERVIPLNNAGYSLTDTINTIRGSLDPTATYFVKVLADGRYQNPVQMHFKDGNFRLIPSQVRTVKTLKNFLNFILRGQDSFNVEDIHIRFGKLLQHVPRRLPANFNSATYNCVLSIIKQEMPSQSAIIDALNGKYFQSGVDEAATIDICTKLKVNISYFDVTGKVWFSCQKSPKWKTFLLTSHNTHATIYQPINLDTKKVVKYVTGKVVKNKNREVVSLYDQFVNDPAHIKSPIIVNDTVIAYTTIDNNVTTIIKSDSIFEDEQDYERNVDNSEYFGAFTKTSRRFKDFLRNNNLVDYTMDANIYDIIKHANHFRRGVVFKQASDIDSTTYGYDQNQAYPSYDRNRYFTTFKLPCYPTHYYQVDKRFSDTAKIDILSRSGFSIITNIDIPNKYQYLHHTRYLQDNNVYTNLILYYLHTEHNVNFDITHTAYDNDVHDITGEKLGLREYSSINKQDNVALIGRLIPGGGTNTSVSALHTTSDDEFYHLIYQLRDSLTDIDYDNKVIYYNRQDKATSKYKGMYHIHSYILDYQQIAFLDVALRVPFDNIIKVKTDAIYTTVDISDVISSISSFDNKHKHNTWKRCNDLGDLASIANVALSINSIDFTDRLPTPPTYLYQLNTMEKLTMSKRHLITGAYGTGKTSTVTGVFVNNDVIADNRLYNAILALPNNDLKADFKQKFQLPTSTYHKVFGINTNKHNKPRYYPNIIVDEATMISSAHFEAINVTAQKLRANLIVVADIERTDGGDWKTYQLSPVDTDNTKSQFYDVGSYYNHKFYRSILDTYTHTHLTAQHRAKDQKLIQLLNAIRYSSDSVKAKIAYLRTAAPELFLSKEQMHAKYNYTTGDIVVAPINVSVNEYNRTLMAANKSQYIKVQYNKTTRQIAKNQRAILHMGGSTNTAIANTRPSYASTVHVVQGRTITDHVFVSLRRIDFDYRLLDVAMSRVQSVDNIHLVDDI